MGDLKHYVIRGGVAGRERLRILARVLQPSTTSLFDRLGVTDGMRCLDFGCGGGDVALELARRVGPGGRVVGADLDATKLEIARREAAELGINNVEFRRHDIREFQPAAEYDLVYVRFLLTHLPDPAAAVATFHRALRPGGLILVEDIDCRGFFAFPSSPAAERFCDLYQATVRRRGGDPNIGPRLPLLLKDSGLAQVGVSAVQPMGLEGEVKLVCPQVMENIAEVVVEEGLASQQEVSGLIEELYALAANPRVLVGTPRVVQAWGRRPTT
jgi:SAM-dependent methyltransferase